jgi:hypothetical protein
LGLQECSIKQLNDIKNSLSEYQCYSVGQNYNHKKEEYFGEFLPIFYNQNRFEMLDKVLFG